MVLAGELIVDPTSVLKSICVHDWSMSQLRAAFICLRRYVRCDERKGITHEQKTPGGIDVEIVEKERNDMCGSHVKLVGPHQEEFILCVLLPRVPIHERCQMHW